MRPYYLLLSISILFSCKKKNETTPTPDQTTTTQTAYKCTACKLTPDAKAVYDNQNAGVYKGVIIGSSGTFKITMQEGDTSAILNFDGTTLVLTKTKFDTTGGQINAVFANGSIVLSITVSSNGTTSSVTAIIPNHTGIITSVAKEKSDRIVRSFEGNYSGSSKAEGVFNMVVVDTIVNVIWKNTSDGSYGKIGGTKIGKDMAGGGVGQITAKGTFSDNDNATGTWQQGTNSGTWSGKRTL